MKRALACGAGGFIGGHLVERVQKDGYWVRGVNIRHHEFRETVGYEFLQLDLREPESCVRSLARGEKV
jgi:nucleoside-diphosphate-sugar epimerase